VAAAHPLRQRLLFGAQSFVLMNLISAVRLCVERSMKE